MLEAAQRAAGAAGHHPPHVWFYEVPRQASVNVNIFLPWPPRRLAAAVVPLYPDPAAPKPPLAPFPLYVAVPLDDGSGWRFIVRFDKSDWDGGITVMPKWSAPHSVRQLVYDDAHAPAKARAGDVVSDALNNLRSSTSLSAFRTSPPVARAAAPVTTMTSAPMTMLSGSTPALPLLPWPTQHIPKDVELTLDEAASRMATHAQWLLESAHAQRRGGSASGSMLLTTYGPRVVDPLTRVLVATFVLPALSPDVQRGGRAMVVPNVKTKKARKHNNPAILVLAEPSFNPDVWPMLSDAQQRGLVIPRLVSLPPLGEWREVEGCVGLFWHPSGRAPIQPRAALRGGMVGPHLKAWLTAEETLARAAAPGQTPAALVAHVNAGVVAHRASLGPVVTAWTSVFMSNWATLDTAKQQVLLHPRLLLQLGHFPGTWLPDTVLGEHVWPMTYGQALRDVLQWFVARVPTHVDERLAALGKHIAKDAWLVRPTLQVCRQLGSRVWPLQHIVPVPLRSEQPRGPGRPWSAVYWRKDSKDQQQWHARIRSGLPSLDALVTERLRLGVAPCMAALLDKARSTHHLTNHERRVMAVWLVAMQPWDPSDGGETDSDQAMAQLVFNGGGGDKQETLRSFVETLDYERGQRHTPGGGQAANFASCHGIVTKTGTPQADSVACPYAAVHKGDVRGCQRACSGTGGSIYHPLDSIMRALQW